MGWALNATTNGPAPIMGYQAFPMSFSSFCHFLTCCLVCKKIQNMEKHFALFLSILNF